VATEQRDLMPEHDEWELIVGVCPLPERIVPLAPKEVKALLLAHYHEFVGVAEVAV